MNITITITRDTISWAVASVTLGAAALMCLYYWLFYDHSGEP